MARMVRKQIYIRPEQEEKLKRCAQQKGISESDLIRHGIDVVTEEEEVSRDFAEEAWEEAKRVIRQRMAMKVPQTGRSWTREELYEERLGRFSR